MARSLFKKKNKQSRRRNRFYRTYQQLKFQTFSVFALSYLLGGIYATVSESLATDFNQSNAPNIVEAVGQILLKNLTNPVVQMKNILNNEELLKLYLFTVSFLFFLYFTRFMSVWKKKKAHVVEDASDYGAYGTARFATKKEILAPGNKNFHSDIHDSKNFGSLIGQIPESHEYIIRKAKSKINAHTLGVAGSGAGKTTAYIINNIILNKYRSIVAGDGKGELYRYTSKQKAKEGFKILYLDFVKFLGNRWNPLKILTFDEIDNFSTSLVESTNDDVRDIWGNQAINYISACIAYVFEVEPKINHTMGYVRNIMNIEEETLKELFDTLPEDSLARDYFSEVSGATGKTWQGIVTTAKSATRFWKQQRIRRFTEDSDFDFTDLGTEKIALYFRVHPTDSTFRPLINTFFRQLFNTLIEEADQFGGRYPIEIDFDLDEFTNIGKIPNFQSMLSYVRALGMNITAFVQDLSQLKLTYGEEDTKSIIANCDNFIFLGTNESTSTAPMIVDKLGDMTMITRNESEKPADTNANSESQSYNYGGRKLLDKAEVLKLDGDYGIYFPSKQDPIIFLKTFSFNLFPDLEVAPINWHIEEQENPAPSVVPSVTESQPDTTEQKQELTDNYNIEPNQEKEKVREESEIKTNTIELEDEDELPY